MVQRRQTHEAAGEFVEEFADYDEEFDYHQRLVADEQFGVIAFQLSTLDVYEGEFEGHVGTFAGGAREKLKLALEERAAQLREEGDGE
ncbi:hypothetical protein [Halostella sp. PRR32]|uniref:hypothetical protein n=1 Tax=Halostella sp. PRR32 TaxID=3098147 RepID=UPI002B1E2C37|nr:hypothetical protein [Halostella sp. PRR32]